MGRFSSPLMSSSDLRRRLLAVGLLLLAALVALPQAAWAKASADAARFGLQDDGVTRVVLDLSQQIHFQIASGSGPGHLVIETDDLTWKAAPQHKLGLVGGLHYSAQGKGGRILVDTEGPAQVKKAFLIPPREGYGWRLVLDVGPGPAPAPVLQHAPLAKAAPPKPEPSKSEPRPEAPKMAQVRTQAPPSGAGERSSSSHVSAQGNAIGTGSGTALASAAPSQPTAALIITSPALGGGVTVPAAAVSPSRSQPQSAAYRTVAPALLPVEPPPAEPAPSDVASQDTASNGSVRAEALPPAQTVPAHSSIAAQSLIAPPPVGAKPGTLPPSQSPAESGSSMSPISSAEAAPLSAPPALTSSQRKGMSREDKGVTSISMALPPPQSQPSKSPSQESNSGTVSDGASKSSGQGRDPLGLTQPRPPLTAPMGAEVTPASLSLARPEQPTNGLEGAKPPPRKDGKLVVVIDPGHGGVDPGALSVTGVYEKNITLSAAEMVKDNLEKLGGYKVVLTRDRDIFIPLRDRVKIARQAGADLFISLHADTEPNQSIRGLSVYTLSDSASDTEAQALAEKENKADLIGGMDLSRESADVTNILIDLAQRETMNKSAKFAGLLVERLADVTTLLNNTHRFAGFAVLKAPDVPSVLVEMGYLSNRDEEPQLRRPEYRAKLAAALAQAVDRYFAREHKVKRL